MPFHRVAVLGLGLGLLVSGCAPKEPAAPAVPVRDEAAEQRLALFGPSAAAPDIAWRASGLGVRIVVPGEGRAPGMTDRIRVHYTGRLKDGRVFDDSHARGGPADFAVNRLLPGWAAGMGLLKPGGRAELFIPPTLGYGDRVVAGIPAGSGLLFEVELIAVNP